MIPNQLVLIAVTAGLLNGVWEWLHFSLYQCRFSPSLILQAVLGDIVMVAGIYILTTAFFEDWVWESNLFAFLVFIALSAAVAIGLEVIALQQGFWAYDNSMPVIPGIEVGLSPVFQLLITPALSVIIGMWLDQAFL